MTGTGTLINAIAILVGGLIGLTVSKQMPLVWQTYIKVTLAIVTIMAGVKMIYAGLNGTFGQVLGQIGIMLLALVLGNIIGLIFRLQKSLNRLGEYARDRFASAQSNGARQANEGFITCTILFCVGPMAILGSIQDGISGEYRTLAIKSAMDGLAAMAFAATFGWGVLLSVIPVVAYQGTITLCAKLFSSRFSELAQYTAMVDSLNAMGGMLILCLPLVILDVRRVPLADYLPSLAVAPLLTYWWR